MDKVGRESNSAVWAAGKAVPLLVYCGGYGIGLCDGGGQCVHLEVQLIACLEVSHGESIVGP